MHSSDNTGVWYHYTKIIIVPLLSHVSSYWWEEFVHPLPHVIHFLYGKGSSQVWVTLINNTCLWTRGMCEEWVCLELIRGLIEGFDEGGGELAPTQLDSAVCFAYKNDKIQEWCLLHLE